MSTKTLLIIDMQNDFVMPGGALLVEGASETIPLIEQLLSRARSSGWNVIHVIREHDKNGVNADKPRRQLFENGGKGYCIKDTWGWEIVKELSPLEGAWTGNCSSEFVVKKTRNSAFFGTNLDAMLRRLQGGDTMELLIAGTQYPNCIRGTAVDAMSLDYDVTVVTDCCSAKTPEVARANIFDLQNMGIKCVPLKEIR